MLIQKSANAEWAENIAIRLLKAEFRWFFLMLIKVSNGTKNIKVEFVIYVLCIMKIFKTGLYFPLESKAYCNKGTGLSYTMIIIPVEGWKFRIDITRIN